VENVHPRDALRRLRFGVGLTQEMCLSMFVLLHFTKPGLAILRPRQKLCNRCLNLKYVCLELFVEDLGLCAPIVIPRTPGRDAGTPDASCGQLRVGSILAAPDFERHEIPDASLAYKPPLTSASVHTFA
jgi:hypothetical protein